MTGGARKEGSEAGNVTSENQALQGGADRSPPRVGRGLGPGGGGQETRPRCQSQKMEKGQHRKYLQHLFKWEQWSVCHRTRDSLFEMCGCVHIIRTKKCADTLCAEGTTVESVTGRQSDGRKRERGCLSPFIMHFRTT